MDIDISKIKEGDILTAVVINNGVYEFFDRNYITFIVGGEVRMFRNVVKINVSAAIDLGGKLQVYKKSNRLSIHVDLSRNEKILKPTIEQHTELAIKLATNGYRYNKHTKKMHKIIDYGTRRYKTW